MYIFVTSNSYINIRESSPYCKITLHVKNITIKSQFLKSVNVQPYVQDSLYIQNNSVLNVYLNSVAVKSKIVLVL